jgi:hypothetical protein
MRRGSLQVNTLRSRSRALLSAVTLADHRFVRVGRARNLVLRVCAMLITSHQQPTSATRSLVAHFESPSTPVPLRAILPKTDGRR